ncbi:uncharacterized protein B0I36DRAFT_404068 [Microdochium trichocladiopsis]|uniref:Uncharacterized protein n=1 Tax=Microdochium trichocladiopsis TaxID=1682393 RepID=A0A9P9BUQ3_9PEZI|nr:uncharacterized protein B0I36DRAFT_404068 [Microdochium trichocladiopsis]KAH7038397.1 hypothetical protein B0I36DRAFT_404068 [Microdochium trichocladiopsis]
MVDTSTVLVKLCTRLLLALEALPLTITQAAAYLNGTRTSIHDYLSYLQGREEEAIRLLSYESNLADHYPPEKQHHAVMKTWLVSLDEMRGHRDEATDGRAIVELLMFLSQIEPKAIPKSMLPVVGGSGMVLDQTIGTLLGYTFLTKRDGEVYDMHSLVHLAIRSWVAREGHTDEAARQALSLLKRQMDFKEPSPWARKQWTANMPHALRALTDSRGQRAEAWFGLAYEVSCCLSWDGRWDDSLRWAQASHEGISGLYPKGSQGWLRTQFALGRAYLQSGQPQTAVEHCERALLAMQAEHTDRVHTEHVLACAYLNTGQPQRALALLQHVVAVYEVTLSPQHPNFLTAQHNLARAYLDLGDPTNALPLLEYVVEQESQTLPPNHSYLMSSQYLLAKTYIACAMLQEAVTILEQLIQTDDGATPSATNHRLSRDILRFLQDVYEALGDQDNHSRLRARNKEFDSMSGSAEPSQLEQSAADQSVPEYNSDSESSQDSSRLPHKEVRDISASTRKRRRGKHKTIPPSTTPAQSASTGGAHPPSTRGQAKRKHYPGAAQSSKHHSSGRKTRHPAP